MKTTNYNKIESYIFDCINFDDYQKQPISKREQLIYLIEIFKTEKRYNQYRTQKEMFIDWCYGLPSCFNMDYQQYKVIELFDEFGLKQPKNEYQLFDLWYGILYDSINYLINSKNLK